MKVIMIILSIIDDNMLTATTLEHLSGSTTLHHALYLRLAAGYLAPGLKDMINERFARARLLSVPSVWARYGSPLFCSLLYLPYLHLPPFWQMSWTPTGSSSTSPWLE